MVDKQMFVPSLLFLVSRVVMITLPTLGRDKLLQEDGSLKNLSAQTIKQEGR